MATRSKTLGKILKDLKDVESENKSYKKFSELIINKPYKVIKLEKFSGKFGVAISVETDTCKMYLPKRYTAVLTEEKIRELNDTSDLTLKVIGFRQCQHGTTPQLEFDEGKTSGQSFEDVFTNPRRFQSVQSVLPKNRITPTTVTAGESIDNNILPSGTQAAKENTVVFN